MINYYKQIKLLSVHEDRDRISNMLRFLAPDGDFFDVLSTDLSGL